MFGTRIVLPLSSLLLPFFLRVVYTQSPANATGNVTFDGFVTSDGPTTQKSEWKWIVSVFGAYNPDNYTTGLGLMNQSLWLETNPQEDLIAENSAYDGCAFRLQFVMKAASSSEAQNDDGSCSSIFSVKCIGDLNAAIKSTIGSSSISPGNEYACDSIQMPLPRSCQTEGVFNYIPIRSVGFAGRGTGIFSNPNLVDKELLGSNEGQKGLFDLTVKMPIPILAVYFNSVQLSQGDEAYMDTRLNCLRPSIISDGSRTPSTSLQTASGTPSILPNASTRVFPSIPKPATATLASSLKQGGGAALDKGISLLVVSTIGTILSVLL
ncbi:MAG: hypothetical protein M1820_009501 [Bogoriella megaspora]|nr:MAG: hypothetical protein M1820_009501 [Bogoriella megaspora]